LRPDEREQVLNVLTLVNEDYEGESNVQINNIAFASPASQPLQLPYIPRPTSPVFALSDISPSSSYPSSPMTTHPPSSSGSPYLEPLTSHFLNSLALNDEFPPIPGLFNSDDCWLSDDADDIWYPVEEGDDSDWSVAPQSPVRIANDTHPNGGVKSSISTSCYPSLFPRNALKRPKDPDMVQPTVPQQEDPVTTPHVDKKEPHHEAKASHNRTSRPDAQKKRRSGSDADDESPRKRPRPQLAHRTNPLPEFVRYRSRPKAPKRKTQKIKEASCNKTNPGSSDQKVPKLEDTEPPPYNAVLQHLAYCY
ncbi:hypothetical protein EDB92DRAFT_2000179, partial [Lactarius akahatsu]